MNLIISFFNLFCKHKYVYNKPAYRVYDSMYRNLAVKRYELVMITRCNKCDKILEITVMERELTKGRLHKIKGLSYGEINNITKTVK